MGNLIKGLLEKRVIGKHEASYALAAMDPQKGPRLEGDFAVYEVHLQDRPYFSTPALRNESIQEGVFTWGAAGYCPFIEFPDLSRYLIELYRDAGAPSWPDTYTPASGINHLVKGIPEQNHIAARREEHEEVVAVDKNNLGRLVMNEDGGIVGVIRSIELPRTERADHKTRIDVYRNGILVDVVYPFATGWGTEKDTVTTTVGVSLYKPGENVSQEDLHFINGEVVLRDSGSSVRSRDVVLLKWPDVVFGENVPIVVYKSDVQTDALTREELSRPRSKVKYTQPATAVMEKLEAMGEEAATSFIFEH